MRKAIVAIIPLIVAVFVCAEVSDPLQDYFEGPAGFLLTKPEAKEWRQLATDGQRESFIELFWARRDPDLRTPVNEFREDFNLRVEAADQLYAFGSTRGAMSDRGRVLILLGKYSRIDNRPPGEIVSGVTTVQPTASGGSTGSAYQDEGATEVWEYVAGELPVKIGKEFLYLFFNETKVDKNDYILDRGNATPMRVLSKMPEALVKHPDLTVVPRFGLLPDSQPATATQLEWFEAEERPWPVGARVVASPGLVSGPRHFLWVHLTLSEGSGTSYSAVGRLRASDSGEEIGTFVVSADDLEIGDGMYQLSVPVAAGLWKLDLALAAGATPIAVTTVEVATAVSPTLGTAVSPFCWGTDVRQEPDSELGDPFNVGGWHIIPLVSSAFTSPSPESLNFMAYILRPELSPEGAPQFTVTMSLYVDGEHVTSSPAQPAQLSKLVDGLWMFGSGLPLERFTKSGEYMLKIELKQKTDGAKGFVEIPFTIVEWGSSGEGAADQNLVKAIATGSALGGHDQRHR
jgi:GWxTD domain-containing protein